MNILNVVCLCTGLLGTIIGIIATIYSQQKNKAIEYKTESSSDTTMKMDIEYIRRRTDENMVALKEINGSVYNINERIARVEERANEAHKRLDRLEIS